MPLRIGRALRRFRPFRRPGGGAGATTARRFPETRTRYVPRPLGEAIAPVERGAFAIGNQARALARTATTGRLGTGAAKAAIAVGGVAAAAYVIPAAAGAGVEAVGRGVGTATRQVLPDVPLPFGSPGEGWTLTQGPDGRWLWSNPRTGETRPATAIPMMTIVGIVLVTALIFWFVRRR